MTELKAENYTARERIDCLLSKLEHWTIFWTKFWTLFWPTLIFLIFKYFKALWSVPRPVLKSNANLFSHNIQKSKEFYVWSVFIEQWVSICSREFQFHWYWLLAIIASDLCLFLYRQKSITYSATNSTGATQIFISQSQVTFTWVRCTLKAAWPCDCIVLEYPV